MAREAKEFGLKIGDILSAGWGYEAETYDFFEVVGFTKTMIKIRELKKESVEGHSNYAMYYGRLVQPVTVGDDRFIGEVIRRKPFNFHVSGEVKYTGLAITDYEYAHLWDGKPCDEYNAH